MREAVETIARPQAGMTTLDYYIGQALQGLLASPGTGRDLQVMIRNEGKREDEALAVLGMSAVKYAYAAIVARDELILKLKAQARMPQPGGESDADGESG